MSRPVALVAILSVIVAAATVRVLACPVAPPSPTAAAFETWRAARVASAIAELRGVEMVGGRHFGYGARPSQFFLLGRVIHTLATRSEMEPLLADSRPVVRLMAAQFFLRRADADRAALLAPLRADSAAVSYFPGGCIGTHATVAGVLAEWTKPNASGSGPTYRARKYPPAFAEYMDATNEEMARRWHDRWLSEASPTLADVIAQFPNESAETLVRGLAAFPDLADADLFFAPIVSDETQPAAVRLAAAGALARWPREETAAYLAYVRPTLDAAARREAALMADPESDSD